VTIQKVKKPKQEDESDDEFDSFDSASEDDSGRQLRRRPKEPTISYITVEQPVDAARVPPFREARKKVRFPPTRHDYEKL
jgi:hypothetical protein